MALNTSIEVVGVDWGTTHRRAYGLDANGLCVAEHADGEGALACQGRFAESLQALLDTLQARPRALVLSGMVGSALGWQVVPYVDGSVALGALAQHMASVVDAAQLAVPAALVPGYCVRNAAGLPDVMRGEETQLLGAHCLGHSDGWFVLPGTHSKWVELQAGRVVQLRTYMTGELFDLLGRHGTLAAATATSTTATDAGPTVSDVGAFALGVQAAQAAGALSHQLFGCRARVVSGDLAPGSSRSYLSGLLIGAELQDVLQVATDSPHGLGSAFKLIGSAALAPHYQAAAAVLGLQFELLDARAAYIAAIHHLQPSRKTV
jgi:2-dehydro-3-deoxygalactonokinase